MTRIKRRQNVTRHIFLNSSCGTVLESNPSLLSAVSSPLEQSSCFSKLVEYEDLKKVFAVILTEDSIEIRDVSPSSNLKSSSSSSFQIGKNVKLVPDSLSVYSSYEGSLQLTQLVEAPVNGISRQSLLHLDNRAADQVQRTFYVVALCSDFSLLWMTLCLKFSKETQQWTEDDRGEVVDSPTLSHNNLFNLTAINYHIKRLDIKKAVQSQLADIQIELLSSTVFVCVFGQEKIVVFELTPSDSNKSFKSLTKKSEVIEIDTFPFVTPETKSLKIHRHPFRLGKLKSTITYFKSLLFASDSNEAHQTVWWSHLKICRLPLTITPNDDTISDQGTLLVYSISVRPQQQQQQAELKYRDEERNSEFPKCAACGSRFHKTSELKEVLSVWPGNNYSLRPVYTFCNQTSLMEDGGASETSSPGRPETSDVITCFMCKLSRIKEKVYKSTLLTCSQSGNTLVVCKPNFLDKSGEVDDTSYCIYVYKVQAIKEDVYCALSLKKQISIPSWSDLKEVPQIQLTDTTLWVMLSTKSGELLRYTLGEDDQSIYALTNEVYKTDKNKDKVLSQNEMTLLHLANQQRTELFENEVINSCSPYYLGSLGISEKSGRKKESLVFNSQLTSIMPQITQTLLRTDQLQLELDVDFSMTPELLNSMKDQIQIEFGIIDNLTEVNSKFKKWAIDVWVERITTPRRFPTIVLQTGYFIANTFLSATSEPLESYLLLHRSTIKEGLPKLLHRLMEFTKVRWKESTFDGMVSICTVALQFTTCCTSIVCGLQKNPSLCFETNVQELSALLSSHSISSTLCLSSVWSESLHVSTTPTQYDKEKKRCKSIVAYMSSTDHRPILIRLHSTSVCLPMSSIWQVWDATFNKMLRHLKQLIMKMSDHQTSQQQIESYLSKLIMLSPECLEWLLFVSSRLLTCSHLANNSIILPSQLHFIVQEIHQLTTLLTRESKTSDTAAHHNLLTYDTVFEILSNMNKACEKAFTFCAGDHPEDDQVGGSSINTNNDFHSFFVSVVGRLSNKSDSKLGKVFDTLCMLLESSLQLPKASQWDAWIDSDVVDQLQNILNHQSDNAVQQQQQRTTVYGGQDILTQHDCVAFEYLRHQIASAFSTTIDVYFLLQFVTKNYYGAFRRFETLQSVSSKSDAAAAADKSVWWDTRCGSGGGLCLGVQLQGSDVGDLIEIKRRLKSKVYQLRRFSVFFDSLNLSVSAFDEISLCKVDLTLKHPLPVLKGFSLPSSSLLTPSRVISLVLKCPSFKESQRLLIDLLDEFKASDIINFVLGLLCLEQYKLNLQSELLYEATKCFDKALKDDLWRRLFHEFRNLLIIPDSHYDIASLSDIVLTIPDEKKLELEIVLGEITFNTFCSHLFYNLHQFSFQKSFLLRTEKAIRRIKNLINSNSYADAIGKSIDRQTDLSPPELDSDMTNRYCQTIDKTLKRRSVVCSTCSKIEIEILMYVYRHACLSHTFIEACRILNQSAAVIEGKNRQDCIILLLKEFFVSMESGATKLDFILESIKEITRHQIKGMILDFLARLSLIADPDSLRGKLASQLLQNLFTRQFKKPSAAALHCYLIAALSQVQLVISNNQSRPVLSHIRRLREYPCFIDHGDQPNRKSYPNQLLSTLCSFMYDKQTTGLYQDVLWQPIRELLPTSLISNSPDAVQLLHIQKDNLRNCLSHLENSSRSMGILILPTVYHGICIMSNGRESEKTCSEADVFVDREKIQSLELLSVLKLELLSSPNSSNEYWETSRSIPEFAPDIISIQLASNGQLEKSLWCCKEWMLSYTEPFLYFMDYLTSKCKEEQDQHDEVPLLQHHHQPASSLDYHKGKRSLYEMTTPTLIKNAKLSNYRKPKRMGLKITSKADSNKRLKGPIGYGITDISNSTMKMWKLWADQIDMVCNDSKKRRYLCISKIFKAILSSRLDIPQFIVQWMITHPFHQTNPLTFIRLICDLTDKESTSIMLEYLHHLIKTGGKDLFPIISVDELLELDVWMSQHGTPSQLSESRESMKQLIGVSTSKQ